MPTISVVIPSYQQAEYLSECIESVYSQTMPPHEIIIVDDGSTDGSLEIAERYKFSQFPLIESPVKIIKQVNKGLPSARNSGIMNATGDYILFLDADDILLEHALERIHNEIVATNADVVAPSFKCFGKENQTCILQPFTMDDLKKANRLPYFCAIKRSVLSEVGGYNAKMKFGWEDYDLWFDIYKRGKSFALIQEVLVLYRVKDKSMIHDANAHSEEIWQQIYKNHPDIFKKQ